MLVNTLEYDSSWTKKRERGRERDFQDLRALDKTSERREKREKQKIYKTGARKIFITGFVDAEKPRNNKQGNTFFFFFVNIATK